MDTQDFVAKELHSLLFLEEFVFSRTKFRPPNMSELELADGIVMLGNVLLIYQIKERLNADASDGEAERRWFKSKVIGRATKQVRDTLSYLRAHAEIRVPNERGHLFNLAGQRFTDIQKVVIYRPSNSLPSDCRGIRSHISKTAGLIHIIDAQDYLEVSRILRVPEEVVRYLKYRESLLTKLEGQPGCNLPEAAIAGHFIGGNPNLVPTRDSVQYLHRLIDDAAEWDIAPFLREMHDHLETENSDQYYRILLEFAKLPRSAWRAVKERIQRSIEKVNNGEFALPYRITFPDTDCGFVFVPVDPEIVKRDEWASARPRAIQNFVRAHMYDQRVSKCVGIMVFKVGKFLTIDWCLIEQPWEPDANMAAALRENFPFREVKGQELFGYMLVEET